MHSTLLKEILLLAGIAIVCGVAGILTGWLLQSLLLGLLLYTAWHLYRIAGLPDIIAKRRQAGAGYTSGLWSDVIRALNSREKETRLHTHELLESLDLYRSTVAILPDAVAILQADGRLVWSNIAAETLLGIPSHGTAGKFFSSLVNDPTLEEYLSAGEYSRPLTLSAPKNRSMIIRLHILTIERENSLNVIVAQDISQQYYLDVSQRDFIANISHELRTPLTVITGLLEQIEAEVSGSELGKRMTGIMQIQALRMRDLIADLLALTELETDRQPDSHETVPVPDILETIIDEARTIGTSSSHVLIPDIQPGFGLHGNATELHTAFSNLVVNAIRHTLDRTEITVQWRADETGARFSVSDSGDGIPARHIPRLTERFYRTDKSRSRDTGGTGLGLSIVKQVLD
ncbi:MAG: DUF3329 domain-containing protein, partial [Gammaproteobacteria bacterium]|nr:DUF3329 domain-containing protein [Gammaproteobacteria bacterium]